MPQPAFRAFALVIASSVVCTSMSARGHEPDASVPAEVVPPRLVRDSLAAYPGSAEPSAVPVEVELTLEVDAAGAVTRATVVSPPQPGFAEAAPEAAAGLLFEPARRGETAFASLIGYRYVFEPAPPTPPPPIEQAPVAAPLPQPALAPIADKPIEVTVHGERREPTVHAYTRGEVRQIPGAFGDPFRAVETLPGVTPLASGLPFYFVRGAPPGNIAYFIDGIRVPYLYHVGAGPSILQPAMVRDVELHPVVIQRVTAALPVASSPRARCPPTRAARRRHAALVRRGRHRRSRLLRRARHGVARRALLYTGALLSLAAPEITLDYRDFQARASYDLTPNDSLSMLAFGAYDLLRSETICCLRASFIAPTYATTTLRPRTSARCRNTGLRPNACEPARPR